MIKLSLKKLEQKLGFKLRKNTMGLGVDTASITGLALISVIGSKVIIDYSIFQLNEEHGHLKISSNSQLRIGQTIELIPSHGCTTIPLYDHYYLVEKDHVIDCLPIDANHR